MDLVSMFQRADLRGEDIVSPVPLRSMQVTR